MTFWLSSNEHMMLDFGALTFRRALLCSLAITLGAALCACNAKPSSSNEPSSASSASPAPPAAPAATGATLPSTAKPAAPARPNATPPEAVVKALESWNVATNSGDAKTLEQLYADRLSFYERIVRRADAARRKQEYVTKHPGFVQKVEGLTWQDFGERYAARFRKTSRNEGSPPSTLDAFVVFEQRDGEWRIVDEGDVQTTRKIAAGMDARRENWKPRAWVCVGCDDPEFGDDPPIARAPLGPDTVKASSPIPPGAPAVVEYGRAGFPRFASAVDVPLFLIATPQSTNGDGRWFFYDDPRPGMQQNDGNGDPKHLLYCAIGGMFMFGPPPANARPDPGHTGEPLISYRTLYERRDGELYFERYLYGADGVENFVYCTFDPAYEAYFYAIVERMGRSMRALGGGQGERPYRVSLPYVSE
jgi:ketosteroid isomerase-like protein